MAKLGVKNNLIINKINLINHHKPFDAMKKLITTTLVLALLSSANAQIELRGGFSFATTSEKLAFQLGAQYAITPEIDLAGNLSFYFPEKTEFTDPFSGNTTTIKSGLWMIDIDGHYNFPLDNGFSGYPLAGLNLSTFTANVDGSGDSNSEVGLNIGGGLAYEISDLLDAFLELKYIIGNADQAVLGLGVLYKL